MIYSVATLAIFLIVVCIASTNAVTQDTLNTLEAQLTALNSFEDDIPTLVRLAFHDAVGGMDGCINLNFNANNGLAGVVGRLETLYNTGFQNLMSRADFWSYAGVVAAKEAADDNTFSAQLDANWRWGRQDCQTSPATSNVYTFPNGEGGYAEYQTIFMSTDVLSNGQTGFGFTPAEVTALMGAHSLGRARTGNSGFDGPWAPPLDRLDNAFHRLLVQENQYQQQENNQGSGVFQWNNGNLFMLNSDFALYRQLNTNGDGSVACPDGSSTCSPSVFAEEETAGFVRAYANNNAAFLQDFGAVYLKMMEHDVQGTLLAVGETAPTDPPTNPPQPPTNPPTDPPQPPTNPPTNPPQPPTNPPTDPPQPPTNPPQPPTNPPTDPPQPPTNPPQPPTDPPQPPTNPPQPPTNPPQPPTNPPQPPTNPPQPPTNPPQPPTNPPQPPSRDGGRGGREDGGRDGRGGGTRGGGGRGGRN